MSVRELDVGLIEGLQQREQARRHFAAEHSSSSCGRESIRRMMSTPPAPAARASTTW
jgi:hypothetical protein